MTRQHPKWPIAEAVARDRLKVPAATLAKWRRRGIPGASALRIIVASDGALAVEDFVQDAHQEAAA